MNSVRWVMECSALIVILIILELYAAVAGDHDMP